jgi:hypothetical protein
MPDIAVRELRRARALLLVVFALTAFQFLFLIADRRLPLGHETGSLYRLQQSTASGREPLGGWGWFEQGTMGQNIVLLAAPAMRGWSFIPFFHLGMFLEELLLLLGVWLLASKFFRTPQARFVVAVAALGSSLWMDHAAVNLLAFSTLPLILYLLHEFLDSRSRPALLLAGLLAVLQTMGRPPAFALLVPAAAALYWTGYALLYGYPLRARLKECGWNAKDAVGAVAVAVPAVVIAATAIERPPSGSGSGWGGFLASAGLRNPLEYLDALLGLSPSLDATTFCGFFTLAFAVLALIHFGPKPSLRLAGFIVVALLVLALLALVTAAFVPSRPARFGTALVRLIAIFLAGFGFERTRLRPASAGAVARGLLLASLGIAALTMFSSMSLDVVSPTARLLTAGLPPKSVSPYVAQPVLFQELAGMSALMGGLAGGVLLLWSSGGRRAPFALALILLLHPLDVFGWKFRMAWMKSASLSRERASTQALDPDPARAAAVGPLVPAPPASVAGAYGDVSWFDGTARTREPGRTAGSWIVGLLSLACAGWLLVWLSRRAWSPPP